MFPWALSPWRVGLLAAVWVAAAVHTGVAMRRYGRRWWVWMLISLAFSPLPAAVVAYFDFFRRLRASRRAAARATDEGRPGHLRCPHCGAVILPAEITRVAGRDACPRCRMVIPPGPSA